MKVSFYLRGDMINCRVHDGKNMKRFSTGIKLPPNCELKGTRITERHPSAQEINSQLAVILATHSRVSAPDTDLVSLCHKYIDLAKSGEIKTKSKTEFKPATIRLYKYAVDTFTLFYQKPVDLNQLSLDGKTFADKQRANDEMIAMFERFDEFMLGLGLGVNTRSDMNNIISIIIQYWAKRLFLNVTKPPLIGKYEPPIIVLDDQFVRRFVTDDHELYQSFTNDYRYIWEVCAVMMVTSLRISDAISLDKSDIINGQFLLKENKKTGEYTEMPLPRQLTEKLMANIDQYGSPYTPIKANVKDMYIRTLLKDFFKQYPEMHQNVTAKVSDARGNKHPETKPLYKWVHPHMLRKTAITSMLANGVEEDHVKFCSGHSAKSTSFERYKGFVEKRYKSQVFSYQEKMFK